MPQQNSEISYLRRIESLAHDVVNCALDEGWLSYMPDPDETTPLQRTVNEIARNLRHIHHEADGCLDQWTELSS